MMICPATRALAQDSKAEMQEKVAAVKQSLAANQKALLPYTWVETTEVSLKGEVKSTLKKECRYGTDGKVLKIDMAGPPAAQPSDGRGRRGGGAVRGKIVESKVDDLKEYMGDVSELVKRYVPPDPAKVQAAVQGGKAALNKESAPGIAELAFIDYVVPGDKMALSFNTMTKQVAAVNVNSYLGKEKETVTLAVRFAALPDGANYSAETVLVAKAKEIQVKITNNSYRK
jgi:hypothetical protein